jgi:hypothetical protein
MELRCPHRMFAELDPSKDPGRVTVKCPSRWCGRREGVVVLHVFDTSTGELIRTERFRDPLQKEVRR